MLSQHPTRSIAPGFQTQTWISHVHHIWQKGDDCKKTNNEKAVNEGHGQESILKRADDRKGSSAVLVHCHGISFFRYEYPYLKVIWEEKQSVEVLIFV
jgi:hypothetical protein